MSEPFATAQDVEDRWRTLTPDEWSVASTLAADASDIIRTRWPDVDARVTAGSLAASSLTRIVANMVKRAMLVGDTAGIATQSQTAGPFSVSNQFTNPTGSLYLTDEDIGFLGDGLPGRRAFAVDLSSGVLPDAYYCP